MAPQIFDYIVDLVPTLLLYARPRILTGITPYLTYFPSCFFE